MSAAIIVTSTVSEAARASPKTKLSWVTNIPSNEMTTVSEAKNTARPAVATAALVARSTSRPSCRPDRNRVTMKRA